MNEATGLPAHELLFKKIEHCLQELRRQFIALEEWVSPDTATWPASAREKMVRLDETIEVCCEMLEDMTMKPEHTRWIMDQFNAVPFTALAASNRVSENSYANLIGNLNARLGARTKDIEAE